MTKINSTANPANFHSNLAELAWLYNESSINFHSKLSGNTAPCLLQNLMEQTLADKPQMAQNIFFSPKIFVFQFFRNEPLETMPSQKYNCSLLHTVKLLKATNLWGM